MERVLSGSQPASRSLRHAAPWALAALISTAGAVLAITSGGLAILLVLVCAAAVLGSFYYGWLAVAVNLGLERMRAANPGDLVIPVHTSTEAVPALVPSAFAVDASCFAALEVVQPADVVVVGGYDLDGTLLQRVRLLQLESAGAAESYVAGIGAATEACEGVEAEPIASELTAVAIVEPEIATPNIDGAGLATLTLDLGLERGGMVTYGIAAHDRFVVLMPTALGEGDQDRDALLVEAMQSQLDALADSRP